MVAVAKRNFPDVAFQAGDGENLTFPNGRFDAVIFSVSFEPDYVGLATMLRLSGLDPAAAPGLMIRLRRRPQT